MRTASMTIHERLRAATGPAHDRLESLLPLLDPGLTLDEYRQLLRRFYGFYAPLERAMARAACEEMQAEVARRHKSPWLLQDLLALGETETTVLTCSLCCDLPSITSNGQLIGALYVVEGATLGGQMVMRFLRQSLGPQPSHCMRFFQSYGEHVRPMWASFLTVLGAAAQDHAAEREIIESACATFHSFEAWLSPPTRRPASTSVSKLGRHS